MRQYCYKNNRKSILKYTVIAIRMHTCSVYTAWIVYNKLLCTPFTFTCCVLQIRNVVFSFSHFHPFVPMLFSLPTELKWYFPLPWNPQWAHGNSQCGLFSSTEYAARRCYQSINGTPSEQVQTDSLELLHNSLYADRAPPDRRVD